MEKVSILGSGIVGMAVGLGLSKLGNSVIFYDIDEKKVQQLSNSGLAATSQIEKAIGDSEISFICVPTPLTKNKIDLSYVQSIVTSLASCLKNKKEYHLVVMKSTVLPKTTEDTVIPLLENISRKYVGEDIGVCMNPEFLTEINHTWVGSDKFSRGFFNEDRIVIGEFDKRSGDMLANLYEPLNVPTIRTNLKTAEMIKYACNCALASRISYWNEIFYICQQTGVNSDLVANVAAMDPRIGKYGTVHGKAFGGKCLPKDLGALVQFSETVGHEPSLLKAIQNVNSKISADKGVRE
jgi:UDPglucose 6-dehydrogenase